MQEAGHLIWNSSTQAFEALDALCTCGFECGVGGLPVHGDVKGPCPTSSSIALIAFVKIESLDGQFSTCGPRPLWERVSYQTSCIFT